MNLSTRSRYGTRMMLDLAQRFDEGPVKIGDIAKRQELSVKYLEQLIIPLKKANFIKSIRGPKGGHLLGKPPENITIGDIINVLEGGINFASCIESSDECNRSNHCLTKGIWQEISQTMQDKLHSITLLNVIERDKTA